MFFVRQLLSYIQSIVHATEKPCDTIWVQTFALHAEIDISQIDNVNIILASHSNILEMFNNSYIIQGLNFT